MTTPSQRRHHLLGAGLLGLVMVLLGCSDASEVETVSPVSSAVTEATVEADDSSGEAPQVDDSGEVESGDGDGESGAVTSGDGDGGQVATGDDEGVSQSVAVEPAFVSFSADIMPILENVCARCHAPSGPGSTHWELATAIDAVTFANSIHMLTQDRYMPPWPASSLSLDFQDNYSLSDEELAAIEAWAQQGGGIDIDPDTPIVSSVPIQRLENPDRILTSAKGPYLGSTDRVDDYRCLIFDPEITEPTWILGRHFEPDVAEVTHHAIVTLVAAEKRKEADWWDDQVEGPGWTCYGGVGLPNGTEGLTRRLGGWAPGAQPNRLPEGYGIPINPGDFIIVQIHYHYDNDDSPADLSRYLLDLASPEEIEANGGGFKSLTGQLYLGPAEIPCIEGDTEPLCDRDLALDRVTELYGEWGRGLAQGMTRRCGYTPEDFAHMTSGEAWSTCDVEVNNPGRIVSVTGHMHELGQSIRLTLHPDTPEEIILLDIPDWDFDWQFGYSPVDDIYIEQGDIVRVECAWGRDRAPYEAVGYILWSDGTGDEMCYSGITTAPE